MMIRREEIIGDCRMILGDNMPIMADMADNEFQLAIVDPPYGIARFGDRVELSNRICKNAKINKWDVKPTPEYFIVWDKQQTVANFASAEYAWTNCRMPAKVFRHSIHKEMATRKKDGGKIHPTQKPVALYRWLLKNYAKQGDHILDTHAGSMSNVIACMDMGFKITAIEIDEDYFNAGVERVRQHQRQGKLFQPPKQQPKPQGLF